jgi:hypothetical protein
VLFLLTALITSAMYVLAPWFGAFYGEARALHNLRFCDSMRGAALGSFGDAA